MKILCDNCGAKYSIADEKVAGKVFRIRCKKCTNVITVRGDQVAAPEEEAAPQAFDYGSDQVWHVVVDGDQQGPFAPPQLGQMLTDGTIDWEAYVWKEGFDGWKPARDVPELVAAITGEAPGTDASGADPMADDPFATDDATHAAAPASFGGGGNDPFGGSADPFGGGGDSFGGGDAFGGGGAFGGSPAPTAARATSDAGADLFAGGSDAFGGADDDVVASAPSPRVSADQAMTGQRNENSVLFSLSNLQALATGGSQSSSGAPSASSGPAPAGHATGEGSGLIDIRALASATAATSGSSSSSSSNDVDDLLSIGGSGGLGPSLGAPVLAPAAAEPESGGKGMIVGLAIAGLLVVGLVAALVVVLVQKPAEQVAAATLPPTGTAAPATATAPAAATEAVTPMAAEAVAPAADEAADDEEEEDEGDDSSSSSSRRRGSRGHRASPSSNDSPAAMDDPEPTRMASMVDTNDIDALLNGALGGGGMSAMEPAAAAMSNLPQQPDRDDVARTLRNVASSVSMCGGGMAGVAQSTITFANSGRVRNVSVMGVAPPVQSCVSRAVRGARVPPFQRSSFNVNYPFRVQ